MEGCQTLVRYISHMQDDDEEDMSGQAMVGQAVPGSLASGDGNDRTDSQVVLGVANVQVDAVLLKKDTYIDTCTSLWTL